MEAIVGAENIAQTGIPLDIPGDRVRYFKLGWKAQKELAIKHGSVNKAYLKIMGIVGDDGKKLPEEEAGQATLCMMEAIVDMLYEGLVRDAEKHNETLTREKIGDMLDEIGMESMMEIVTKGLGVSLPDSDGSDPTKGQKK